MCISVKPSFLDDLIKEYRYRARRGISKCGLKGTYSEFLSCSEKVFYLLKDELFFVCQFFHKCIQNIQVNIYKKFLDANKKYSTRSILDE